MLGFAWFGFYCLAGVVVIYLRWPYDKGARKVFADLAAIHWAAVAVAGIFAVLIWPAILFDLAKRQYRKLRERSAPTAYLTAVLNDPKKFREMDERLKKNVDDFIRKNPVCIRCGAEGGLGPYRNSAWIICSKCGRRTFMPDPSVPESVDAPVPNCFCDACRGRGAASVAPGPGHPGPAFLEVVGIPPCFVCGKPVEDWMPMKEVESGKDFTRLEPMCMACWEARKAGKP